MTRILAISGSLRNASSNTAILKAVKNLAVRRNVEVVLYNDMGNLPHFNPDLDGEQLPSVVKRLRRDVADADALLISSPEYAHGIPGAMKNLLDWLVSADDAFVDLPLGLINASPAYLGATFAQQAMIEVLKTMSGKIVESAVLNVDSVRHKISADGKILDPQFEKQLETVIASLSSSSRSKSR